jgi:hypothetical protein
MNMKNQRSCYKKKNVMKTRTYRSRGKKRPIGCTGNDGTEENEDILGPLVPVTKNV